MTRGLIVIVLCALTHVARADDADTWFRKGRELMAAGKIVEACEAFDKSQTIDPTVATMLNQAGCRERNNQLATAFKIFREAESQIPTNEGAKKMRQVAHDRAEKLQSRVSRLTINVAKRIDGLVVERNGVPVTADQLGQPQMLDGGTYTIDAHAPGRNAWSKKVEIKVEGDQQTIEIPELAEPKAAGPTVAVREPTETRDDVVETHHRSKLPFVLTVTSVVLLGGALGCELWGRAIYADAKVEEDDAIQESLWKSANAKRYTSQGLLVGGVAVGAVAVWMFMRGDASPTTSTAQIVPVVDGEHAGFAVMRAF